VFSGDTGEATHMNTAIGKYGQTFSWSSCFLIGTYEASNKAYYYSYQGMQGGDIIIVCLFLLWRAVFYLHKRDQL
jgi:hypothetical protein